MKQNVKTKFLKLTKATFESSSIHAVPNIVRSDYLIVRLVWGLCLLLSVSICGFLMNKSIINYFNYETVSKTEIKYVSKLLFPIITICNLNIINTEEDNELISSVFETEYPNMTSIVTALSLINDRYQNKAKNTKINELILTCSFNFVGCFNEFVPFFDPIYGSCLKLNSNSSLYSVNNGQIYGLTLELLIESADKNKNLFSYENGLNIFINSLPHIDSNHKEGVALSTGTSTRIIINKNILKKQPKPYNECINEMNSEDFKHSELYEKLSLLNTTYTFSDCKIMCFQKFLLDKCSCQYPLNNIKYNETIRPCLVDRKKYKDDEKCAKNFISNISLDANIIEMCKCPIECDKTTFTYTVSTSEFPTLKYYYYLKNQSLIKTKYPNISYEELKKRVARVYIFYDEIKETIISESIKMDVGDLISNLGGTLGLFLGMSFLSLIEFVEILIQTLIVLFQTAKSDRKINRN